MSYTLKQIALGHYTLSGIVSADTAQNLEQEGIRYLTQCDSCHLALEDLLYFDSALIATLLSYQRFAIKHNKPLVLEIRSQKLKALMQVYSVYDLFTHFN